MANGSVTEFSNLQLGRGGHVGQALDTSRYIEQTRVSFTTTTASAAFNETTRFVRVQADADCFIAFGLAPEATVDSIPLKADTPEYFGVLAGHKVAFVAA